MLLAQHVYKYGYLNGLDSLMSQIGLAFSPGMFQS